MEDKTIIALAAMIIMTVLLSLCLVIVQDGLEIKIGLAMAMVAVIGSIAAYAFGIEKKVSPNA